MAKLYHLTREQVLEAIRLRQEGTRVEDIKDYLNAPNNTLRRHLLQYNLKNRWEEAQNVYERSVMREVIKLRKKGMFVEEIALEVGMERSGIFRIMKKYPEYHEKFIQAKKKEKYITSFGKKTGKNLPKPKDRMTFSWLYAQRAIFGLTYQQIADMFGCSVHKVRDHCIKYNIKRADEETRNANRRNAVAALDKHWGE